MYWITGEQFVSQGRAIVVVNTKSMRSDGSLDSLLEEPYKRGHFPSESGSIPETGKGAEPTVCHRLPGRIGQIQNPVSVAEGPISDKAIPSD